MRTLDQVSRSYIHQPKTERHTVMWNPPISSPLYNIGYKFLVADEKYPTRNRTCQKRQNKSRKGQIIKNRNGLGFQVFQ